MNGTSWDGLLSLDGLVLAYLTDPSADVRKDQMAEALGWSSGAVERALKRLERRGLIERGMQGRERTLHVVEMEMAGAAMYLLMLQRER